MRGPKRVVFALASLGEPRNTAALAECAHAITTACQDFMRIALVANVPDQPVMGRIEDIMQGDGQLDDTERSA